MWNNKLGELFMMPFCRMLNSDVEIEHFVDNILKIEKAKNKKASAEKKDSETEVKGTTSEQA
jgi:hypothetical protein